ncbi:efflux transporter, outer membrane factor (OMF) lipoprotein, NodT family [Cupriavidus sp. OV038]|jgi:NodT family efflux transporter outer membrane factor (OMF) lipoprotein|uniref:efflux transporter outer membrane subunit n=1 Tax=unclassified Cupriavidus TaxID=2640874 RepID=UPI0008F00090|nr:MULTISPECIES: efflux transporter outer membrane subunit [unclassified Cupriavidus]SFD05445.1 efflux transporter, outer membrane factor (OMF) lipoprotein, NodT family [Cupriavidus sp. OV038]SFP71824.1 efflux transporter, outer membrane factor (OMF) lipoprotein, NodT family [Cupriavidus sp. OV096]
MTKTITTMRYLVPLLPLALVACTLEPTYQRPESPVPQQWPTGAAYQSGASGAQAASPGQAQAQAPAASLGWEDFFTDARLRRLIELALANNRDLRIATLSIDQARAQYRIQRAAQFPAINGSAGFASSRISGDLRPPGQDPIINAWTAGVGFNAFELDLFGRVRSLKHEALEQYLAIEEVRRSAQISLVAEVASAYLTLRADQELLKISQDTLKVQEDAAQMIDRSKRAGGMAQLDTHRAQTQLETARVGVEQYTRQVAQDENALALLIGGQLPADLPAPQPFENNSFVAELPAGLPSTVLEQRPDIMAAEHRLKAANANIGAARAAFFPTISLTASVGAASSTLAGLFSGGMAWVFAPQITLPIFNAGANQARLTVSEVQKDINVAAYEKTIQGAFREVADGLAARGTYDRQTAAQEALAKEITETRRLSEIRFKNGVDDYFGVFDAQRQLYNAQQTLVTIRLARLTSRVGLYKALGGGWTQATVAQPAHPAPGAPAAPAAPAAKAATPAVTQPVAQAR